MNECAVDHCDQLACHKGHCRMHYERIKRGRPLDTPPNKHPDVFDQRYVVAANGCWIWQGAPKNTGYGTYRSKYAHRVSYERAKGPIPDGMQIDHLCRVRLCVNPDHLEAVTPRINILRSSAPTAVTHLAGICKRGHRFTPENTYARPDGKGVQCRTCNRIRRRKSEAVA